MSYGGNLHGRGFLQDVHGCFTTVLQNLVRVVTFNFEGPGFSPGNFHRSAGLGSVGTDVEDLLNIIHVIGVNVQPDLGNSNGLVQALALASGAFSLWEYNIQRDLTRRVAGKRIILCAR